MEIHPVQKNTNKLQGTCNSLVTKKAYEVYSYVIGEQPEIITGNCRGGFGVSELIAFLYAGSFPKDEWKIRVKEAFEGMKNI
jgi:hypothetical protein